MESQLLPLESEHDVDPIDHDLPFFKIDYVIDRYDADSADARFSGWVIDSEESFSKLEWAMM